MGKIKDLCIEAAALDINCRETLTISELQEAIQRAQDALFQCECCWRFMPRRNLRQYASLMCIDEQDCLNAFTKEFL